MSDVPTADSAPTDHHAELVALASSWFQTCTPRDDRGVVCTPINVDFNALADAILGAGWRRTGVWGCCRWSTTSSARRDSPTPMSDRRSVGRNSYAPSLIAPGHPMSVTARKPPHVGMHDFAPAATWQHGLEEGEPDGYRVCASVDKRGHFILQIRNSGTVFSVRLSPNELVELHRQAMTLGVQP